jgi:superfamily II DNA or RNA helicase
MSDVTISKKNEVYIKLECEPHILYELQPYFTFEVANAKFSPAYKKKYWNGKIYLLSLQTGEIYAGLLDKVIEKLKAHNYTYKFQDNKYYGPPFEINELINPEGVKDYMTSICSHTPRDYQISGVTEALKFNRKILLSPTGSGKSLMIYSLVRYYVEKGEKILIIVPTTSLVSQIYKDFIDYGWDAGSYCHKIYAGAEKNTDFPVTISTWQAIFKLDKSYFDDFGCVIMDECHNSKAKSLVGIMTKLHNAKYRFGFTGTFDGIETHKWVLEGLFGPSYKITKTDELMQQGVLSKLDIQCIVIKHPAKNFNTYEEEIQYLISNDKRNKFISKLALSLKGNTLILFSRVETHGAILYEKINSSKIGNRKVFFVHGGVDTEERELVREITERENDAIIVASYGVFSTGINIKMLHNIIFASPSKSRVRNLQSIGRALRVGKNKNKAMLYDIADDCSYKARKNYTLNHFIERVKLYNEENFNYQISNITITGE